ncbi:MAG: T9SS type A sorting domain-containing protein, partial [Salinivirgaceae bacterium]|nr:T9SS type A sorting domain-containing protein [Salinivirgaceae bacterium]
EQSKSFEGYSVYLDGVEKATGLTATNYVFENLAPGTYTLGVKSVFSSGSSAIETMEYDHDTPVFTVTFKVKNAASAPIAGASVTINGKTLVTNAQGITTIDLLNGDYAYVITKTGYNVVNNTLTVAGANVTEDVTMTGIEDAVATQNVVLYPNPVAEMLTIVRSNNSNAVVEIYSNNGTMVKGFEMNEAQKEISVSELNSGVYFVRIIENQTSIVKRFIKN